MVIPSVLYIFTLFLLSSSAFSIWLSKKLSTFNEYIDSIDIIYDEDDIELINDDFEYAKVEPKELLGK